MTEDELIKAIYDLSRRASYSEFHMVAAVLCDLCAATLHDKARGLGAVVHAFVGGQLEAADAD